MYLLQKPVLEVCQWKQEVAENEENYSQMKYCLVLWTQCWEVNIKYILTAWIRISDHSQKKKHKLNCISSSTLYRKLLQCI